MGVNTGVVEPQEFELAEESREILSGDDETREVLRDSFDIREEVFIDEQEVSEDLEWDGYDDESTHFVVYARDSPVATARLREKEEMAKIERVAVLKETRGEGWGRIVMEEVENFARSEGYEKVVLHAQKEVEGFYSKLGYETTSDEFTEAGIPHVEMEKDL